MFRKSIMTALVLACVLAVAGPAMAKSVKIAIAGPYTGPAAAYGDNIFAGAQMKADEINKAGGINGATLELVKMDEQCDPKEAAVVAPKIAGNDELVAVLGHVCSSAHLAALPVYVKKGVPVLSATATNVTISQKNADRKGKVWSFRNVYLDDYQGSFLANYIKSVLGLTRVAVFYENNDYGIGLKSAFENECKAIGLEIVGVEAYMKGTQDFTPQLTSLKANNPDGLFIAGYHTEGALIAGQAQKLGLNVMKFGGDGLDNGEYITLAGAAANNTFLTVPFLPELADAAGKQLIADYKDRYGRDIDWMSVNAYDGIGLLATVIGKVGADRKAIQAEMAAMTTPELGYTGVGGLTFFNEVGDCKKNAFVKMVKDEAFVAAPKQMD